jgi:hypothetical protein
MYNRIFDSILNSKFSHSYFCQTMINRYKYKNYYHLLFNFILTNELFQILLNFNFYQLKYFYLDKFII